MSMSLTVCTAGKAITLSVFGMVGGGETCEQLKDQDATNETEEDPVNNGKRRKEEEEYGMREGREWTARRIGRKAGTRSDHHQLKWEKVLTHTLGAVCRSSIGHSSIRLSFFSFFFSLSLVQKAGLSAHEKT